MSQSSDVLILDGGMSRELMRIGAPFKQPEWSAFALMEAPHFVQQVHENFAAAGADIITTNSYAVVPFHIGEERFRARGRELADLAGKLARAAADNAGKGRNKKLLVAGCLPPVFGSYRPDLYDSTRVQEYLGPLVKGLCPHVDLWLGETLSVIAEAEAVASAVKGTEKPLWISFTVNDQAQTPEIPAKLRSGELIADAAKKAVELGAGALLFNCSRPEFMDQAIEDAKTALAAIGTNVPIGVYANAFEPRPASYAANEDVASTRDDLNRDKYGLCAQNWVDKGATIVGGCCGIGSDHIGKLAELFKR